MIVTMFVLAMVPLVVILVVPMVHAIPYAAMFAVVMSAVTRTVIQIIPVDRVVGKLLVGAIALKGPIPFAVMLVKTPTGATLMLSPAKGVI